MKYLEENHQLPPFNIPADGVYPDYLWEPYKSTILRSPKENIIKMSHPTVSEMTGPQFNNSGLTILDDLTKGGKGEPLGERIIVHGKVLDENNKPISHTLIEIWQANAAGRYLHKNDQHNAPLDPNFKGLGRIFTDINGHYSFTTIKPGAYPWGNHENAWRPQHIHFSLFGPAFSTRLVTQMYFPGDPLLDIDPIYNSIRDENARARMISRLDMDVTVPFQALAYEFNFVLRGRNQTFFEDEHNH